MVTPLTRKLLRDIWRVKLQAIAIALVVAAGVMQLIMMSGLVTSLEQTRAAYYDRYRFADVFAPVVRAPERVLSSLQTIDGVGAVEGRITGGALIDIDGEPVPIRAQALSLPAFRAPRLNNVYLAAGRAIDPAQSNEILLLESFAIAHDLGPGDTLSATMNGRRWEFTIAGLAQSPEFLYSAAPGELIPDDARFAIIWAEEDLMAAAFDMDGAFNEALVRLDPTVQSQAVISAVDRLLEPFGSSGAYGVEDQFSNRFVMEEISGLRVSGATIPPIFLAVAAFLLYIVVTRMVESERTQIGLLKAFGYTDLQVSLHYFRFVLVIAVVGALIGCGVGVLSGQAMASYYQVYYKFPFLVFRMDPGAFLIAMTISILAASTGSLIVLRKVFQLPPAVAMRPPAPADYSRTSALMNAVKPVLDQPTRMVLRRILRQPLKAVLSLIGIATGMGLSVSTLSVMDGFDRAIFDTYAIVDRSDAAVTFTQPRGEKAITALERLDGIFRVEPFRATAVILRNDVKHHRGGVTGLITNPELNRALTADNQPVNIPKEGIVLSTPLASKLDASPGDTITVEVREGRRPVLQIPVTGVSDSLLGAPAYMDIDALNDALDEPNRYSGAYVTLDSAITDETYTDLKNMPVIAGVAIKEDARAAFTRLMDEGAGATRYIMALLAGIIAFGIVFNSARIAFAEREHELASLRVLGFSSGETAYVLLGELALITFFAIPAGILIGVGLTNAVAAGFSTDLYTIPAFVSPNSIGEAAAVVLLAAAMSILLVKRDVDRLDMVSALKSRE